MRRVFILLLVLLPPAGPARPESGRDDPVGARLMELGRYEEAVEHYRVVVEREPGNVDACTRLGTALCGLERTSEAMGVFKDCIDKNPDSAELYFSRGACEQRAGGRWLPLAGKDYRKAIALKPENPAAYNQLGLMHQQRGEYEQAAAYYRTALRFDPHMYEAYNNLGACLIQRGRFREAIEVIQKAISKKPDLTGIYLYTNLGIAFLHAGMNGRAEAAFLMETAINPNYLEPHLNLGNLYALSERYPEAYWEYKRVLVSDPDNKETLMNLGAAYVMAGRHKDAVEPLEKALALEPDYAAAHYYLAEAYQALGKTDEARRHRTRAQELGLTKPARPWPEPEE